MFKVNEYVVYSSMGVYKIVDIIKDKDIDNNEIEYYVLQPAFNNNLTIKTPVNNPKVSMRGVIKKEDVLSLIASMPETETVWIDDKRERSEDFKAALKSGESMEWARLIKTLYLEKQEKSDLGKKLWKVDEDVMKSAEKILNEEFAVALNIAPEEVPAFINDHISQMG
jgi:CarD family transcriptional regulator